MRLGILSISGKGADFCVFYSVCRMQLRSKTSESIGFIQLNIPSVLAVGVTPYEIYEVLLRPPNLPSSLNPAKC